jgi:RNA-directed DNA polymerase
MQAATQEELIGKLNPIIGGWGRYYRTVASTEDLVACEHHLYASLWQWAKRRHPNKNAGWRASRYWDLQPGHRWNFAIQHGENQGYQLKKHSDMRITRHVKVKGRATPYDGNITYWATRLKKHPLIGNIMGRLLAIQGNKCPRCGLTFKDEDLLEVDHCIPRHKGGSDTINNKQILHRHCHDQKTAQDD